jgi:hypothetical protein
LLPFQSTVPVKPSFSEREVTVQVSTLFATAVDGGPIVGPSVRMVLAAGKYLTVACPQASGSLGPFGKECELAPNWVWEKNGDLYRARVAVRIKPSSETPAANEASLGTWTVKVTSADVANAPQTISVGYADSSFPAAAESQPITTLTGGFRGTLEYRVQDQSALGSVTGREETADFTVPVTALAVGNEIRFYDTSRSLSTSGILKMPLQQGQEIDFNFWEPQAVGLSGRMAATLAAGSTKQNSLTGLVVGHFTIFPDLGSTALQGITVTFRLEADTKVKSCATAGAICPSNFTCTDEGFCSIAPFNQPFPPAGSTTSTVATDLRSTWLDQSTIQAALAALMTQNEAALQDQDSSNYFCGAVAQTGFTGLLQMKKFSGEGSCGENSDRAFPFVSTLDAENEDLAGVGKMAPKTGQELFKACLDELKRAPSPAGSFPGVQPGDTAAVVVGKALTALGPDYFATKRNASASPFSRDVSCVSLGNFFAILKALTATANPALTHRTRFNQLHYANTLRNWAALHAFIARQASQGEDLDKAISGTFEIPQALQDRAFEWKGEITPAEALDVVERGWALIEQESQRLTGLLPDVLADPDYLRFVSSAQQRTMNLTGQKDPKFDRNQGLAPTLLEMATANLKLVEGLAQKANLATYEETRLGSRSAERERALARAGSTMRAAFVLHQRARDIHDGAILSLNCQVPCVDNLVWEKQWRNALNEYRAQRSRVSQLAAIMGANGNPLGIEEDDVPLFFGDPMGTNSRFFASSDYLLNQWAVPAVDAASTSLTAAREAWISARNSRIQDDLLKADQERRIEDIERQFAKPVIANCGLSMSSKEVFANDDIDPNKCFINPDCPGSGIDLNSANDLVRGLTTQILNRQLYLFMLLNKRYSLQLPPEFTECIGKLEPLPPQTWNVAVVHNPGVEWKDSKIGCLGTQIDPAKMWGNYGQDNIPNRARQQVESEANEVFGSHAGLPVTLIDPKCYRGNLGGAYSRVVTARAEVDGALKHLVGAEVEAGEKAQACLSLMSDENERKGALAALAVFFVKWGDAKAEAAGLNSVTGTLEGVVSGSAGGIPGAIIGGFLGFFKSQTQNNTVEAEDNLRYAEKVYSDLLENQRRSQEIRSCWGEFHSLRVALDTDAATIRSRAGDLNSAIIEFRNLHTETGQTLAEGRAAEQREKGRPFGGYAHHYWLSEKVDRFTGDFAWSKRLTYLAMRAVEHDFQQSLGLRTRILSASHPDQLREIVRILQQEQASRTINRRRPEESSLVLSLRDDVLRVADRSMAPFGERAWGPAQRLRSRLAHPKFRIYDRKGDYLGQGIRFTLDQHAGGGQGGVALTHRCGERMWRVTATVQGDGLSPREPGTPVFLLKRNTFSSQWCDGRGPAESMQVSSVQPSRQLFRPSDAKVPVDEGRLYTTAVLYPWFNIRRADFYKKDFQSGASEELAGRGLYGDYVLLFPKELSRAGFQIDKVEDVLLRVDYLSIDNLPQVLNAQKENRSSSPSLEPGLLLDPSVSH